VPATQDSGQGYHRVWTRDLYEMATGLAAAGDKATARDIVQYMLHQLESPDGYMPQNSLVDGTPVDTAVQMDEIAYPLLLAWSIGIDDRATYHKYLQPLGDYIVRHGPITDQERWEEDPGYSPSTIAAEIAGLTALADIAQRDGDAVRALAYQAVADEWQRSVKSWTVTTNGPLSRAPYFIRIDDNLDPNDGDTLAISGGPPVDERAIVDGGFLELVRLGVLPPTDTTIAGSLAVVDRMIRVNTANGPAWYRYNHDNYGDARSGAPWNFTAGVGIGHPWPVFDGERGEYTLALGKPAQALSYLETMRRSASPTGLIPEQIWERRALPPSKAGTPPASASIGMTPGQADGSATPLNWALGQYIRLLADAQAGTLLDRPAITTARYVTHPVGHAKLAVTIPAADITGNRATKLTVAGMTVPGSRVTILVSGNTGGTAYSPVVASNGAFRQVVALPVAYVVRVQVAVADRAGNTALVLRRVRQ
jgi:glucoamylase